MQAIRVNPRFAVPAFLFCAAVASILLSLYAFSKSPAIRRSGTHLMSSSLFDRVRADDELVHSSSSSSRKAADSNPTWTNADYSTWWHSGSRPLWKWEHRRITNRTSLNNDFYPGEIGLSESNLSDCSLDHYTTKICRISSISNIPFVPKRPTVCLGERTYPVFSFDPARDAFTLADVATLFNQSKVVLGFIGDSLVMEIFHFLLCHLSRIPQVKAISRKTMLFNTESNRTHPFGILNFHFANFDIYTLSGTVIRLQLVNIRMNHAYVSHWMNFNPVICARFDFLFHGLGLHYNGKGENGNLPDNVYLEHFRAMHKSLAECSANSRRTIIGYMSHSAQHFDSYLGWYRISSPASSEPCKPIVNGSVSMADKRTRWLMSEVLSSSSKPSFGHLVPPPWESLNLDSLLATCTSTMNDTFSPRVYFFPQFDITFELDMYHSSRRLRASDRILVDCTHFSYHPDHSVAFADALFWAVFRETNARNGICQARIPTRPQFSSAVSKEAKANAYANFKVVDYFRESTYIVKGVDEVYAWLLKGMAL